jgi:hypothetical protein
VTAPQTRFWQANLLDAEGFQPEISSFRLHLAADEVPDPMAGMRPPHVPDKPVPVFAGEELPRLERACAGRGFQQQRDRTSTTLVSPAAQVAE